MVNHILKQDGKTLTGLFKNLEQLRELNQLFEQYADKNLVAHCSVVNVLNGNLIILADNGNWATQLRFQIPDLLENFRRHPLLCGLKSIICKTRPDFRLENPIKKRKRPEMQKISAKVAQKMLADADEIQDKKLRDIVKKIALRSRDS